MKALATFLLIALVLPIGVSTLPAQAPSGPPTPGPEHEKLAYFVGKWLSEGDMKPSPYGPGGKLTFTETCDWFAGKFALVCNSDAQMFGAPIKGISIMSYDPGEKTYVYFETNSMGENNFSRGTVDGDTWTWTGENKMNGKTIHSRFTLKRVSADSTTYKFEMASGSDPMAIAPLKLYDGKWDLTASGPEQKITHIENHCSRTGLFFVCEQIVNGKSEALVVFLPLIDSSAGAAQEYRMQALIADASPGGGWSKLTIDGDRWVYSWESTEGGKKISWRNVNTFSGPDKIHYEVQRLAPDNSWKTEKSGDERRVK